MTGQADDVLYAAYQAYAMAAPDDLNFAEWDDVPDWQKQAIGAALDAGREAAALEPQPAPGPGVCECGHSVAHHAFGDDVCAVLDCPCTRPRPAPVSASQARGDLDAATDALREITVLTPRASLASAQRIARRALEEP